MDLNERIFKELQAHTSDSNTLISSVSSDEKLDAYRKQWLILDQITSTSSDSERMSVYRSQLKGFHQNTGNAYDTFIQERSNKVQILRPIPPSFTGMQLTAKEFLNENKIKLENECSGKYQSCRHDEVNADDLKIFEKDLIIIRPLEQIESPTRKEPKPSASRMELPTTSEQRSLKFPGFRTAREELIIQNMKKNGDTGTSKNLSQTLFNFGASKKSLGARHNGPSRFVSPIQQKANSSPACTPPDEIGPAPTVPLDKRLQNIEPNMIELIKNEIMHKHKPIDWEDIAGLEYAKATIKEAVVWPMLRPDIFTGLRRPPRGILLFGPPGTGKTLIGKCIASQSQSTFFSISASSLTSKYVGDGEKMVRALFAVAAVHQPSVIFIDEIDSLLTQRSETEHEASRRLKTEFLIQLDGAGTSDEERILIVGATNRPQELDEAARRRLVRRLYIPLPELSARVQILRNLLQTVSNSIRDEEIFEIGSQTDGYSGADMETLCREASMEPIRSIPPNEITTFNVDNVRPVLLKDFNSALLRVRASVSQDDLQQYADWNRIFGAGQ